MWGLRLRQGKRMSFPVAQKTPLTREQRRNVISRMQETLEKGYLILCKNPKTGYIYIDWRMGRIIEEGERAALFGQSEEIIMQDILEANPMPLLDYLELVSNDAIKVSDRDDSLGVAVDADETVDA